MLFPITDAYEKVRKEKDEVMRTEEAPKDIMWFKQTIGNACGTMGILHAVANSPINLDPSSALAKIFEDCKTKTPLERATYLEQSAAVESAHSKAAQEGQTEAPASDNHTDLHFSCFVAAEVAGKQSLVELDGRRLGPIVHGPLRGGLLEASLL
ncbi:MAG: ubiquitinyl hydrolase 1 [Cyphobasidiales sp. Tagirdzhanova-0007]|nr:MAG: ubiquitinyl hydrolase 1 [Cyphobasidiales sp. Tagirdzhanova-0007]